MNKDQIKGRVEQATGKVKEVAGKVVGNDRLETEGLADAEKQLHGTSHGAKA